MKGKQSRTQITREAVDNFHSGLMALARAYEKLPEDDAYPLLRLSFAKLTLGLGGLSPDNLREAKKQLAELGVRKIFEPAHAQEVTS